ncbi:sugar O-acetyltransferase [Leuconostoc falkenbergense]|jgi:maltose O-acetyltransferase|uniref:Acetyltransferase n=1 Tax=Leuconostoc falkenbergense TaxID=2766470 RepID=A0A9X3IP30_9LACO|nr:sugar O-acetyltransferase [Leuconostoc falkenbergense]RDG17825.1 sugar O-acetyltransferase [Leuconostoc pseudomesenteroides]MCT4390190.1 sugar O-acetyltransferase [Leuconostoc falkenbergense]MCT4411449.1 sugar O-acetyltransferase [Leuconostoc falkenbergense]MCX7578979.1 sugar O-acetyltransferase [Leuconostoc falkenbergense]MDM7647211.1 sugar O-acetyltransferase [Leuconostoc falkenbergense]
MGSQKENMLAGKLYRVDQELSNLMSDNKKKIAQFNQATSDDEQNRLIQTIIPNSEDSIHIEAPFHCDYGDHIHLGNNFYANYDCIMLDVNHIYIGNNVLLGPRVSLYTAGHPLSSAVRNSGLEFGKSITIGDNAWVGGNTIINPGVKIGCNTVIGSGSVVTKDIPDNVIAAGNPCRVIRKITEQDELNWQTQAREISQVK